MNKKRLSKVTELTIHAFMLLISFILSLYFRITKQKEL